MILEEKLQKDGFNVLNNGVKVPFPLHWHKTKFHELIRKILPTSKP